MSTVLILPPVAIMADAARTLIERTTDATEIKLLNKAIYALQRGIEIEMTAGALLIPSSNKSDVYRLTLMGQCSCKGGTTHGHCYHGKMVAIIEEAQQHTMPVITPDAARVKRSIALARSQALSAELFG